MSLDHSKSGASPRASVLMPVYNNASFLEKALASIMSQTFADFEFIIVDDGSNDGSTNILANFEKADRRIRVLRNDRNMGIVFSLNRGLKECRGEYIVRMDSDDISMPSRLEEQIAAMDAGPEIAALGSALSYIDADGKETGIVRQSEMSRSLLRLNPLFHPTVVIRRAALDEHGLTYLEDFRYAEDYYLWMQLSRVGRLSALSSVLLKYRISNNASRIKHLKNVLRATLKVKIAGVTRLGLRPNFGDMVRFWLEVLMIAAPARLVQWVYMKITFGNHAGVAL